MKIGLLTYHHTSNFGSMLQTYGLYLTVIKMGHECEVIDYRNGPVEQREFLKPLYQSRNIREAKNIILYGKYKKRKSKELKSFLEKKMQISSETYDAKSFQTINGKYDCILVGSDLVWDFSINGHDFAYMLDAVDDKTKKIAFASSVGSVWNEADLSDVCRLLNRFDAIAVRENTIKDVLSQRLDKNVDFVCDPTMLVKGEYWDQMARPRMISEPYVVCYMNAGQAMYDDAIAYGHKHNLPVYMISCDWVPNGLKAIRPKNIEEFLSLIKNAETVFSASYHGMLFSLYFNKNFYFYNRGWKDRMKSIADYLQLADREHWNPEKDSNIIDYTYVNQKLDAFRESSLEKLSAYLGKYE